MPSEYADNPVGKLPRDFNPFDDSAIEYDAGFDGKGKLIFDIEVKAFHGILESLQTPWIEIGAGSGRFARALGINTGIEPSINLANMARQRGIMIFEGKGEQRLLEESSFGTIFLINTLCFLDSPVGALKEAYRILKPGGKIVLGLVLKTSPWGQYYQKKKLEGHPIYQHANFYQANEVARMTIQSGFTGERIISTLFQKPGEVREMEEPKDGLYGDAGFVIIVAKKKNAEDSLTNSSRDTAR